MERRLHFQCRVTDEVKRRLYEQKARHGVEWDDLLYVFCEYLEMMGPLCDSNSGLLEGRDE